MTLYYASVAILYFVQLLNQADVQQLIIRKC